MGKQINTLFCVEQQGKKLFAFDIKCEKNCTFKHGIVKKVDHYKKNRNPQVSYGPPL